MSDDQSKKRLGRGLAALIGDIDLPAGPQETVPVAVPVTSEKYVPIELIGRNPNNPRRNFSDDELDDLAQSIREHGIVQPVVVRPSVLNPENFELIAGERRWRAAQRAGLIQLPVIIRDVDDRTALELAIIENVQRTDLNPLEEAMGYQHLIDEHEYTQADLAQVIGKSRSHVANTLRLLKLPPEVQQFLNDGALSAGHARCLITAEDPTTLAEMIVSEGLSVRQAEMLAADPPAKATSSISKPNAAVAEEKDADTRALEKRLADMLGLKINIKFGRKGGDIRIFYKTLDQLDDICRRLET